MDAAPPPPPAIVEPQFPRVAATDLYARNSHEADLCKRANEPDWLYLTIPPALVAGAVVLDTQVFKYESIADGVGGSIVRDFGPALIGISWGLFVGSIYPSMPQCTTHYIATVPPEGQVRTPWAVALAFALLAGATAPMLDYIAIGSPGFVPSNWTDGERVSRVIVAGTLAFGAALVPYLLPTRPMRAMRELLNLRASVSAQSTYVSYTLHF